ncbi:MAG: response regulator transcription factor [Betaproteobacteria bacterium]
MRLLLVEDDLELANGLVNTLAQSNYVTDAVHTGQEAVTACATLAYQLVILDLGLPDEDGISVLSRLRQQGFRAPVLILTARDDLNDRIRGLDAGADDYLSKPFEFGELEARIRALLRRGLSTGGLQRFGEIEFDSVSRFALVRGNELTLTARELAVLEMLLLRPGKVVSKQQMLESLYSWEQETNPSVIEVFISRLRRKLDDTNAGVNIRVLRGLGYRLELSSNG